MPDLGATSAEITILRWLVELNQTVERGQPLMEVETDKAIMPVESIVSGVVRELLVECNQSVEVGQVVALIETDGPEPSAAPPEPQQLPALRSNTEEPTQPALPLTFKERPRSGGLFSRNRDRKSADASDSESNRP